jgi:cytochrome c553
MKLISSRLALHTAFLAIVLPAAAYAGDTSASALAKPEVQAKIQYCKACHGASGRGFPGAYPTPRLAGQTIPYLENRFGVIIEHRQDNPTAEKFMEPALGSVDPAIRKAVATYFNGLDPAPLGGAPRDLMAAGRKIYREGVPEAGVPACAGCHGPEAKGSEVIPRLAGQLYRYTTKVLTNWTIINKNQMQNPPAGAAPAGKAPVEHSLTKAQIAAVAAYLSDLQ